MKAPVNAASEGGSVKVAYVLGTSEGGTVRHVRMLADGLAARGATVTVYAPATTWAVVHPAASGPANPAAATTEAGTPDAGPAAAQTSDVVTSEAVTPETRPAAAQTSEAETSEAGVPETGTTAVASHSVRRLEFTAVEIAERPRPAQDLAALRRLRMLLRRARPDVVHAHGLRAGALAALAVRGRGRPGLVVTVHNAAPTGGVAGAVYRVLERLVARRADAVLCVSSDLEARMRALGARHVSRALVPAPPVAAQAGDPSRDQVRADLMASNEQAGAVPIVLAVGRLAAQKGFGTLVEAAGLWRDRDPVPLLVIAGDGPLGAELAQQSRDHGAAVRFLGARGDVPALLAAADVVVVPSVWEGQPLIVQEILRAGRPLVASRVGGIPDLTGQESALLIPPGDPAAPSVPPGDPAGLLVPPGDPAALSAAVLSVLDDPALAGRLSEAARRRAATLPTEQEAVEAAMTVYTRLTNPTST